MRMRIRLPPPPTILRRVGASSRAVNLISARLTSRNILLRSDHLARIDTCVCLHEIVRIHFGLAPGQRQSVLQLLECARGRELNGEGHQGRNFGRFTKAQLASGAWAFFIGYGGAPIVMSR